jgi:hypothetical protein
VPQSISQVLTRTSLAVDEFDLNSRFGVGRERFFVPIVLSVSFPGDSVESFVALVAENEPDVVVINLRVDKQSSLEVNVRERVVTNRHSRIAVEQLHHLSAFVVDDPSWILLIVTDWIKSDALEGSEVGRDDFVVVWADIVVVVNFVVVKVVFTDITDSIVVFVSLITILRMKFEGMSMIVKIRQKVKSLLESKRSCLGC